VQKLFYYSEDFSPLSSQKTKNSSYLKKGYFYNREHVFTIMYKSNLIDIMKKEGQQVVSKEHNCSFPTQIL
jgi:hypothetical protein